MNKKAERFTTLATLAEPFAFRILDVLEYEQWSNVGDTLHQVSTKCFRMAGKRRFPFIPRGHVLFCLSRDRRRARAVICLSNNPPVHAVSPMDFGEYTPELIISVWLHQCLGERKKTALLKFASRTQADERADLIAWLRAEGVIGQKRKQA